MERLKQVRKALTQPQRRSARRRKGESATEARNKRGLLDFGGEIIHTIFGLATDSSVEDCRNMVRESRKGQVKIVHRINEMVSILNSSYDEMDKNRERINEVSEVIRKIIPRVKMVIKNLQIVTERMNIVERTIGFDRAILIIEMATHAYVRARDRFQRQKASLELGRLTEEVLPPELLLDTLRKGETVGIKRIMPIQWYYEHVRIYPVWGGSTLIYKATLPLVDSKQYFRYSIVTWPVPYNLSGYTIQLEVHEDIGLDTQGGEMFHPSVCQGVDPMVCRTGARYREGRLRCPRGLITGDNKQREACQVLLSHGTGKTQIQEISPGEYVVVTWGENIAERCRGKDAEKQMLNRGVYLIAVSDDCSVDGKDWILTGFKEKIGRLNVKALKVEDFVPVGLTDLVPESEMMEALDIPTWTGLKPVVRRNLAPLPEPEVEIDWPEHGGYAAWGIALFVIGCGILVIVVIIRKRYKRQHRLRNTFHPTCATKTNNTSTHNWEAVVKTPLTAYFQPQHNEEAAKVTLLYPTTELAKAEANV
jgi:hypothetical protein